MRTSSTSILFPLLATLCASALSAQGYPEQKIPRQIQDLHDLKLPAPPVSGKTPLLGDQLAATSARPAPDKLKASTALTTDQGTPGPLSIDENKVYYDNCENGAIWAVGRDYKASFDASGFSYVPFFGSDAPKNFPVHMAVRSARVGSRQLELRNAAVPARTGDRIVFDRGSLLEIYDLKPRGVEQTIRVIETGAEGAVRVEIGVDSELAEDAALPGIQFVNALGRVEYGEAALVHANGSKTALGASFSDGAILFDVAEAQRDGLGVPVTIDPLIYAFPIANTSSTYAYSNPDISYDLSTDSYLMVWERRYSTTDSDVLSEMRTRSGLAVPNSFSFIDGGTESWSKPRVANLNLSGRYLIVAEVAGTPRVIKGRTRDAALPVNIGGSFVISGTEPGDKTDPDVGGDPSLVPSTFWTVVYTRKYSATDSDIHARLVEAGGVPHGPTILLENSVNTLDYGPRISNSDGNLGTSSQRFFIVWTRAYSATDHDIYGAVMTWDGGIQTPTFAISTSTWDDSAPTVSSPADAWSGLPGYMVAFERSDNSHIHGGILNWNGGFITGLVDLTSLQGLPANTKNFQPSVDSDGSRFALAYYEGNPGYVATFHLAFGNVGISEPRVMIESGPNAGQFQVNSVRSGGGSDLDYAIAYTDYNTTPASVRGAIYQGYGAGGHSKRTTGCGGLGITSSGMPAIGRASTFALTGVGADLVGMLVGLPGSPVTLCGTCRIGINLSGPILNYPNLSSLKLTIPTQGAFVGTTLSVQGYAVGTPTCFSTLRLGDTADFKIQ